MNELCLLTNMTSSELAAWVQALGSVLALVVAFLVVWWQHRAQARGARKDEAEHIGAYSDVLALAAAKVEAASRAAASADRLTEYLAAGAAEDFARTVELLEALWFRAQLRPDLLLGLMQARDAFKAANDAMHGSVTLAMPSVAEPMARYRAVLDDVARVFEAERRKGMRGT